MYTCASYNLSEILYIILHVLGDLCILAPLLSFGSCPILRNVKTTLNIKIKTIQIHPYGKK